MIPACAPLANRSGPETENVSIKREERLHFDAIAQEYDDAHHLESIREEHILSRFLKWFPASDGSNRPLVLEVGGGTGHVAVRIAQKGFNIIVSDLSSGMLALAKHRFEKENLSRFACFAMIDGERLAFAGESLDYILIVAALHHMVNPQKFFSEAHRCLRSGGYLILGDEPNSWTSELKMLTSSRIGKSIFKVIRLYKLSAGSPAEERGQGGFKKKQLLKMATETGFTVLEFNNLFYVVPFLGRAFWCLPSAGQRFSINFDEVIGKIPLIKEFSWSLGCLCRK